MQKVIVIGYGEMFANLILGIKDSGNKVVGVMRHDRIIYDPITLFFKDIFAPSKDKSFIDSLKIHEIKAPSVNSEAFIKEALKLNPDIILVGSWSEKLKLKTIKLPKLATINTHPSLLPKYRGPNPYAQTIMHGEIKTGLTFHLIDSDYDTGAILHQVEIPIMPDDTGNTLKNRCVNAAKIEIQNLLNKLDSEIIIPIPQKESVASYQKQLSEKDILINFTKSVEEIDRHIRGLTPWLKCYFPHKNSFFRVNKYEIINKKHNKTAGTIIKKGNDSIIVACLNDKMIKFSNLELLGLPHIFTTFYIKYFVKAGDHLK
ncbi:MAG: formyltransferase family protein [Candidatus Gastranaerophilales bacterium]|nr:formyltransferase family protein [Candidatus Gastranaerophilales bacterium]